MSHRLAVIGAGWYGCHIASSLNALGFDATVFEKDSRPLHGSSGNNQFRLHLGFHYPRHYGTRMQSRNGFMRFIERYPLLSTPVEQNIYAVPRDDSLIDYLTYRLIMTSSGIEFSEIESAPVEIAGVEGMFMVGERVLQIGRARKYFLDRLGTRLNLNVPVEAIEERDDCIYVNGSRFDFVVDATWGHFSAPPMRVFYEPTLLLYYQAKQHFPAVTLVDGPLCSVYPTENPDVFTLSSVPHTPLGSFPSASEAAQFQRSISNELVTSRRAEMERQISKYIPAFQDIFTYAGPQLAIKTKPIGNHDDRSCYVNMRGRVLSVMSGKIDTIFFATERILFLLEGYLNNGKSGR
jgi:hypothetical protein